MGMPARPRSLHYPVMLDLAGRDALLVGGGTVATRKAVLLLDAGAALRIVSPVLAGELRQRVDRGEARWEERGARASDVGDAVVVVCAASDPRVNRSVADEARRLGRLVSVADDPASGSFIVPTVVRRGSLLVAVSTGGASPSAARYVGGLIDAALGPELERLVELAARLRERARRSGHDADRRERVAAQALPRLAELLRAGLDADAETLVDELSAPAAVSG